MCIRDRRRPARRAASGGLAYLSLAGAVLPASQAKPPKLVFSSFVSHFSIGRPSLAWCADTSLKLIVLLQHVDMPVRRCSSGAQHASRASNERVGGLKRSGAQNQKFGFAEQHLRDASLRSSHPRRA